NRPGMGTMRPFALYDKTKSVKALTAVLYDARGNVIRKFKKRDFNDVSATGSDLYTDSRALVLDFTPTHFPFTFEIEREVHSSNTAFLPRWDPMPMYDVSTEFSSFEIVNPKQLPLVKRTFNFEEYGVSVSKTPSALVYKVESLAALDSEPMSPHYTEFKPFMKVALQEFRLKSKAAKVRDWREFGLWQQNSLLNDRNKLPNQTLSQVSTLVSGIDDPKDKARAIYNFMQDRTRYISVQIGIGGWQPMLASEVDKLNYGDCKALTNYTMALLESQGIESYYTIVSAGEDGRDLDEEFVALQGNHVILSVPFEDEMVFLECTNQQVPFNYIGTHTDDRKVLMVTPEGGVMTKTHTYSPDDNGRVLKGTAVFDERLTLTGIVEEESSGIRYGDKYPLESVNRDEITRFYAEHWFHLNDLKVSNVVFENDKRAIVFKERLNYQTDGYVSKAGNRILLNPNIFNRQYDIPEHRKDRLLPLEIRRGYTDIDEIEISLPEGYEVTSLFEPVVLENEYGQYEVSITPIEGRKLRYRRYLKINSGRYPKEKFAAFVEFSKEIVKKDKSKIVLSKT
ncbi:MAG: DUF3857 domain-containing protein, partial [Bacteroidota bacterium]